MNNRFLSQIVRFVGISGLGWLIDFSVYTALTALFAVPVGYANFLSAIPAVTFVFLVSTRRTFVKNPAGLPMWGKYCIYVAYELVLVFLVSCLNQALFDWLCRLAPESALIAALGPTVTKVLITPVTVITNFFVLRYLAERM